jgi:hypothetical protein
MTRLKGMIAIATVKRIESRVADRGIWLRTSCVVSVFFFNCGEADRGGFEWVQAGGGRNGA